MKNKNLYIFIGKVALEFRVSLDNICKILGKENTEENKMEIYNILIELSNKNKELISRYNYLFFSETLNEKENISQIAYTKAINYIKRYSHAKKEGTPEEVNKVLKELDKTEDEFFNIKNKIGKTTLTQEEVDIISKYRIKRVISRLQFCSVYDIKRTTLEKREKTTNDLVLLKKLEQLGEFFFHFQNEKARKKSK